MLVNLEDITVKSFKNSKLFGRKYKTILRG